MSMCRLLVITAIVLAAACGGSTGTNPPPPPPPPGGGHSTTITVDNNSFSPTPDTIPAGTITFSWAQGAVAHNVTWQSGPPGTLPTNSGDKTSGTYTATLVVGTYTYRCTNHGGMNGQIVVQ